MLYHLHSLGAAGDHGFGRLTSWVDHVAGLGCSGVLLTPIFVSSTHGYDTIDPFHIDGRLGDEDDFAAFVDACHGHDLRVVLDGVFNHVGRDFPAFGDVLANGGASRWADWFRLDFSRDDGDGFGYATFEGHRELVALNHRNPEVLAWAGDVARHWLDRGADGWRFDAAYAIPRPFTAELTATIRRHRDDAFVFGEVIHGDYAGFVAETGVDSITQYELHKAIWSSLNDANFFELAWALKRHRALLETFAPVTFVGNHDVTRIATLLAEPRHLALALALLFTVPGRPCVYYGDEFAWRGVKEHRAGGDDAIRPPLPETPEPVGELEASTLVLHRDLIELRRSRPWLTTADVDPVEVANRRVRIRMTDADHVLETTLDVDLALLEPPDGWRPVLQRPGVLVSEPA